MAIAAKENWTRVCVDHRVGIDTFLKARPRSQRWHIYSGSADSAIYFPIEIHLIGIIVLIVIILQHYNRNNEIYQLNISKVQGLVKCLRLDQAFNHALNHRTIIRLSTIIDIKYNRLQLFDWVLYFYRPYNLQVPCAHQRRFYLRVRKEGRDAQRRMLT